MLSTSIFIIVLAPINKITLQRKQLLTRYHKMLNIIEFGNKVNHTLKFIFCKLDVAVSNSQLAGVPQNISYDEY